jgi:hypothetical protein
VVLGSLHEEQESVRRVDNLLLAGDAAAKVVGLIGYDITRIVQNILGDPENPDEEVATIGCERLAHQVSGNVLVASLKNQRVLSITIEGLVGFVVQYLSVVHSEYFA